MTLPRSASASHDHPVKHGEPPVHECTHGFVEDVWHQVLLARRNSPQSALANLDDVVIQTVYGELYAELGKSPPP